MSSRFIAALLVLSLGCAGCGKSPPPTVDGLSWDQVVSQAKGQTVRFAMWDGDPMINAYMRDFVTPRLASEYGIHFQQIGGQGNEIVNRLMVDMESGRRAGDVDLVWINGESFYQLRQIQALYGPFTDRLPNARWIDWDSPFIAFDFQQPVEGMECPWGNVQLALIYHNERVTTPPKNRKELAEWVQAHPGRFTFDTSFTGLTFLKSLLIDLAGDPKAFDGPFDEAKYDRVSEELWKYVHELKPNLWRKGQTFPESVAQLHQLFMNNEVDFTMSNNDGEVDNKAIQGLIPEASQGYVLDSGTIRNSHFVGIPFNSPNKAAALVLANFLISPEAQYEKATPKTWGDGTVLDAKRLPEEWKKKFEAIPGRTRVPSRIELEKQALTEPAPQIMVRLHEDLRKKILESGR